MQVPSYILAIDDHFKTTPNTNIKNYNIPDISPMLKLIGEAGSIVVVGDYDVDGIMATLITLRLCMKLGKKCKFFIPRRMTDGYGLNVNIIDHTDPSALIITVDNGINAQDAISRAQGRGQKVIVIDHHPSNSVVPRAEIIFDPKYDPSGFDYTEYCGAGLVYKIAQTLKLDDDEMLIYATLATLADAVTLSEDNFQIVRQGIKAMDAPPTEALRELLMKYPHNTTRDIVYGITPIINAPGRIIDNGGNKITMPAFLLGGDYISQMEALNEERKGKLQEALSLTPRGSNIRFLYAPDMCEGICGIVAGRLSDQSNRPSFVMAKTETGIVKGSCRCKKNANVSSMLESCKDLFETWGGHSAAAAFSLKEENVEKLFEHLESLPVDDIERDIDSIEIKVEDAADVLKYIEQFAPFGQGREEPLVSITLSAFDSMLVGGKHLKIKTNGLEAIKWNYTRPPLSKSIKLTGHLAWNDYRGVRKVRLYIKEINENV